MDIANKDGNILIGSFNATISKYFKESQQLLVTYPLDKQSAKDMQKWDQLLNEEDQIGSSERELVFSEGWANEDSGGGTDYTVSFNEVERLTPQDVNGGAMSNTEILLFKVSDVNEWSV